MFARFRGSKSNVHWQQEYDSNFVDVLLAVGASRGEDVDPSCNSTITITCLKQLYGINHQPSARNGNQIGLTGYLNEFANIADLQLFYAMQAPAALKSTFSFISVNGSHISPTAGASCLP